MQNFSLDLNIPKPCGYAEPPHSSVASSGRPKEEEEHPIALKEQWFLYLGESPAGFGPAPRAPTCRQVTDSTGLAARRCSGFQVPAKPWLSGSLRATAGLFGQSHQLLNHPFPPSFAFPWKFPTWALTRPKPAYAYERRQEHNPGWFCFGMHLLITPPHPTTGVLDVFGFGCVVFFFFF